MTREETFGLVIKRKKKNKRIALNLKHSGSFIIKF